MTKKIDPAIIRSVVVRCPNWIGDAIMATPFLQRLRELFKDVKIVGLGQPSIEELYRHSPFFDEFVPFSRAINEKKRAERAVVEHLKVLHPDLGILLTNSFSSAWMFWRARIAHRVGFVGHMRRFLLTHSVREKRQREKGIVLTHDVVAYMQLLEPFLDTSLIDPAPLHLAVSQQEKESMGRFLEAHYHSFPGHHQIIVINPGAAYGSAKCWPLQSFRALIEKLLEHSQNRVFVTGDRSMVHMVDEIVLRLPPRVYNLCGGTSLRELMTLISLADGVVSNDSGPMHIASAFSKPLVAIFGSTNPHRTGPYNGGEVIYKAVSCSPCYLRTCPIDFRCMTTISPEEVYLHLMTAISKKEKAA